MTLDGLQILNILTEIRRLALNASYAVLAHDWDAYDTTLAAIDALVAQLKDTQ